MYLIISGGSTRIQLFDELRSTSPYYIRFRLGLLQLVFFRVMLHVSHFENYYVLDVFFSRFLVVQGMLILGPGMIMCISAITFNIALVLLIFAIGYFWKLLPSLYCGVISLTAIFL